MPAPEIISRLERTHRRFNLGAVQKLYPSLSGEELTRAVARESMRQSAYLENMRSRVSQGAKLIERDPSLGDSARRDRLAALEKLERHYLRQHVGAVAWRMSSEAALSRLKEQGEPGGFWELGNTKTHTTDCLAMAGKFWEWGVLDRINPANRHNGCDCRVISKATAERRGYRIVPGVWNPGMAKLTEAGLVHVAGDVIKVPVRAGAKGGNPYHDKGGRFTNAPFVRVPGVPGAGVAVEIQGELEHYLDEVKGGDLTKMDVAFDAAVKATRAIEDPKERGDNLRMLSRVRAAAINPEGVRTRAGTRVTIGGESDRPVPVGVPEPKGNTEPWGEKGNFAWFIHGDSLGATREKLLTSLRDSGDFDVTESDEGATVETRPDLDPVYALAVARDIEILAPQLRNSRLAGENDALGTNTPLDMHPDEIVGEQGEMPDTRYPLVAMDQMGVAAEALAPEARERMVELGLLRKDDTAILTGMAHAHTGAEEDPLDWEMGHYGVEVKSEAFRGMSAFLARKGGYRIGAEQRARKIAAAEQRDLKPALVQIVVDFDNDTGHIFFHEYDENAPFTSVRLPTALRQSLIDGKLKPGDAAVPSMGKNAGSAEHQTVYLGTFRLPYNPLRASKISTKRELKPGRKPNALDRGTLARRKPGKAADVGPGDREAPEIVTRTGTAKAEAAADRATAKGDLEERNERIGVMWLPKSEGGQELSQSEIARRLGLSQAGVRKILVKRFGADALKKRGKSGTRHDRPASARGKKAKPDRRLQIVELFDKEYHDLPEIARRLKTTRGYVKKVLLEEGVLGDHVLTTIKYNERKKDPLPLDEIREEFGLTPEEFAAITEAKVAESHPVPQSLDRMEPIYEVVS